MTEDGADTDTHILWNEKIENIGKRKGKRNAKGAHILNVMRKAIFSIFPQITRSFVIATDECIYRYTHL